MPEILIYGLAANDTERYMEQLLCTQCKTQSDIDALIEKATNAGFHSFRITTFNWEKPDFAKTVAI